ncbi:MAG TPA: IPT/TIG domain-containing protein [Steroidobacteraceae bacterium]
MHHWFDARHVASVSLLLILSACGGGDGNDPVTTGVSTNAVSFHADAPDAAAPASQTVTATFASKVVQLAVIHSGDGVERVSYTLAGNSAVVTIEPSSPSLIGAGEYSGAVAITGYVCADAKCQTLAPGNTLSVKVTYEVAPAVRLVAPDVATANVAGRAIIHGAGFANFAVSGVMFGSTPATSFTVVSDTELQALYPALAAGSYPVEIAVSTYQGTISTTATLDVLDPVPYTAAALNYPAASPAIHTLLYDATRSSLIVATDIGGGTLVRYPYVNGAWGAPESVAVSSLKDVALSTNSAQLLAVSPSELTPINADTLETQTAIAPPALPSGNFLTGIAVANTNRAVLTTSDGTSDATLPYVYDAASRTMTQQVIGLVNASAGTSADGTQVILTQGDPSFTTDPAVYFYDASTEVISALLVAANQKTITPALDTHATRVVLNGVSVYDTIAFTLLGTLPSTTLAVVFNPDGTRAYTYDSTGAVLTFDTSTDMTGAAFTQIGAPLALAANPGDAVKMTISPDGNTLFLAGSSQLVIQPAP